MVQRDVKDRVIRAVEMVYARDADLLRHENSEWSVAHRLAFYLEEEFPGWNVDCEYNRQGTDSEKKRRDSGNLVRPDIIVHRRGQLDRSCNLLAVEVKKLASDADLEKVREYTSPPNSLRKFQYQYGVSLIISEQASLTWFSDGELR